MQGLRVSGRVAFVVLAGLVLVQRASTAQSPTSGVQDPVWAPDGKHVAVSYLDRIWVMTPEGRQPKALDAEAPGPEREPAWSPDGGRIAFAASRGDGFDVYIASLKGGAPMAVTTMPGDERWPSWTPDGRIVFAHRDDEPKGRATDPGLQWDLFVVAPVAGSAASQAPIPLNDTADSENYLRVSPDGRRVVYVSDRDSTDDVDLWAMPVPPATAKPVPLGARPARAATASGTGAPSGSRNAAESRPPRPTRVTRTRGDESS